MSDIVSVSANPGNEFRPTLMWFWNGQLDETEIRRQIGEMAKVGIGSFFVHPMFGFAPDYLSKEHLDFLEAARQEAVRLGMQIHLYDEYNWPSGPAGGRVIRDHPEYRSRQLLAEYDDKGELVIEEVLYDATLPCCLWSPFCWDQPGYLDVLSHDAVKAFLDETYQSFAHRFGEAFGKSVIYIFTDEPGTPPQLTTSKEEPAKLPWTAKLPELFLDRFGYDLTPRRHELFVDTGDYVTTRLHYWRLIGDLFVTNYSEQVQTWCSQHGIRLTGHLLAEEEPVSSVMTYGNPMRALSKFDLPGIDSIFSTRTMHEAHASIAPKLCASVAHHEGRTRQLCETYTGSGWDLDFEDMKRIFDWQCVLGTNWLMFMGGYYTIADFRKYSGGCYPPSHLDQRPDWPFYKLFNEYVTRSCALSTQGNHRADVAVLYPLSTVWCEINYGTLRSERLHQTEATFTAATNALLESQRDFDYIAEEQLERAHIGGGRLSVGGQAYSVIILPGITCLSEACVKILMACRAKGVHVLFLNRTPDLSPDHFDIVNLLDDVEALLLDTDDAVSFRQGLARALEAKPAMFSFETPQPNLLVMHRSLDDREQLHIVNRGEESVTTVLNTTFTGSVWRLDPMSGSSAYLCDTPERVPLSLAAYETGFLHFTDVGRGNPPVTHKGSPFEGGAPKGRGMLTARPAFQSVELRDGWRFTPLGGNLCRLDGRALFTDEETVPATEDERWRPAHDPETMLEHMFADNFERWKGQPYWLEVQFELTGPCAALELVWEDVLPTSLWLNDVPLPLGERSMVWDHTNRVVDLTPYVKTGTNRLLLRSALADYRAPHIPPFLALRGDFQVDPEQRLVPCEKTMSIQCASWADQGYPNFSGTGVYTCTIEPPDGAKVELELPEVVGVVQVIVNDVTVGTRLWQPYAFDITDAVGPGSNTLEVRLTNTLANLFEKPVDAGILRAPVIKAQVIET